MNHKQSQPEMPRCQARFAASAACSPTVASAVERVCAGTGSAEDYHEVADMYFRGEEFREAVDTAKEGLGKYPESGPLHRQLIRALDHADRMPDAIDHATIGMVKRGDVGVACAVELAGVYKRRENLDRAEEILEMALADNHNHPELLLHSGVVAMLKDDDATAKSRFDACVDAAGTDTAFAGFKKQALGLGGTERKTEPAALALAAA